MSESGNTCESRPLPQPCNYWMSAGSSPAKGGHHGSMPGSTAADAVGGLELVRKRPPSIFEPLKF